MLLITLGEAFMEYHNRVMVAVVVILLQVGEHGGQAMEVILVGQGVDDTIVLGRRRAE